MRIFKIHYSFNLTFFSVTNRPQLNIITKGN